MRKIIDDQDDATIRLSVPSIYEKIKKSNSSLNRKPKRLIEDSLERVLEVVKADMGEDDDSVEGDFEGLEEPPATVRTAQMWDFGAMLTATVIGAQWNESESCWLMGNT